MWGLSSLYDPKWRCVCKLEQDKSMENGDERRSPQDTLRPAHAKSKQDRLKTSSLQLRTGLYILKGPNQKEDAISLQSKVYQGRLKTARYH